MQPWSILRAGLAYFAIVFAVAFALGSLRVLVVAPRLGPVAAVLVELPLILVVSWITARFVCRRFDIHARQQRLLMGSIAFILLQAMEVTLGLTMFHQTFAAYLANIMALHGMIGLAGQMLFGIVPALLPRD